MKKKIMSHMLLLSFAYGSEGASERLQATVNSMIIYAFIGVAIASLIYILISLLKDKNNSDISSPSTERFTKNAEEKTPLEAIKEFHIASGKITIKNQVYQLSNLLHLLTNRVAVSLKKGNHLLYYDVKSDVDRYIVGDTEYVGRLLKLLIELSCQNSSNSDIVLRIQKRDRNFILFEIRNSKSDMNQKSLHKFLIPKEKKTKKTDSQYAFYQAQQISKAMKADLDYSCGKNSAITYSLTIPFEKDKDQKSNQHILLQKLSGKRALMVSDSQLDSEVISYMFSAYGLSVVNMSLSAFGQKKPDTSYYDMAIMRSKDLKPVFLNVFKSIYSDKRNFFKILVIHDLFLDKEQRRLASSVAHAELFGPATIGDVEEILFKLFVEKSTASISSHGMDIDIFKIKEKVNAKRSDYVKYAGSHILIAENNQVSQRIVASILNIDGIVVHKAQNGKGIVNILKKNHIDLIFTDINMPIMDGYSVTKLIKAEERWKRIPIVAVTSLGFEQDLKKCLSAGMDGHIIKPYKSGHFYKALDMFLVEKKNEQNIIEFQNNIKGFKRNYINNKKILNVEEGIHHSIDEIFYCGALSGTIQALNDSTTKLETLIESKDADEIQIYISEIIPLYENIHAVAMTKILSEILVFSKKDNSFYLGDYIPIYRKNWKELGLEIKRYSEYLNS